MIGPHVHLRDWDQSSKETLYHGLKVAYLAGYDMIIEMPNTSPAIVTRELAEKRMDDADRAREQLAKEGMEIEHGLYMGLTSDPYQIEEAVKTVDENPRVHGAKLFLGHSVGNMGLVDVDEQYSTIARLVELDFRHLLPGHCEKEAYIKRSGDKQYFDPSDPITHAWARPEEAELFSAVDFITMADQLGFKGRLHICHVSAPAVVNYVELMRPKVDFDITVGLTPQHALLDLEYMNRKDGILYKVNPPLRSRRSRKEMFQALIDGRIDWIETDHAPHTLDDKLNSYASGLPGFPIMPHFLKHLRQYISDQRIEDLTHNNIQKALRIEVQSSGRAASFDLFSEYEYNPYCDFVTK
mgnify:CR=1 FL=1